MSEKKNKLKINEKNETKIQLSTLNYTEQTIFINHLIHEKMNDLKKFFDGMSNLNGAKFINLNGYKSETSGEVANHNILTNIKVMNAKKTDNATLKTVDLVVISNKASKKIALDVFSTALSEMIISSDKNLSEKLEDRTTASQAQTDAYLHITDAIRIHKETGKIHIFGFANRKKVLVKGEYKTVNSSDKTLAKQEITKVAKLRAGKFRTFILNNISSVALEGKTLNINCD